MLLCGQWEDFPPDPEADSEGWLSRQVENIRPHAWCVGSCGTRNRNVPTRTISELAVIAAAVRQPGLALALDVNLFGHLRLERRLDQRFDCATHEILIFT